MWLGCGSDVARMSLDRVFGCGRQSLAEVKGKEVSSICTSGLFFDPSGARRQAPFDQLCSP